MEKKSVYLDLELTTDMDNLKDPEIFLLQNQDACIVLDEILENPESFPLLRVLLIKTGFCRGS
jgi:hypothetical protein